MVFIPTHSYTHITIIHRNFLNVSNAIMQLMTGHDLKAIFSAIIQTNLKFTFIDLFAGTGGIRIPFDELGGKCVLTSEWDKYAQKTYYANFGEWPNDDIRDIKEWYVPDHDILLGGFPCQAFSVAGHRQGFEDKTKGTLFFEIAR